MLGLTRRSMLAGGAATTVGLLAAEAFSLLGTWDHRELRRAIDAERASSPPETGLLHIGHSTHVIRLGGVQVLTDPWFYDPAFGALVHERPPACDVAQLSDCAVIAISHAHPDHFDPRALDRWPTKSSTRVFVGDAQLVSKLKALGFSQIVQLDVWESDAIGALRIHAVPAIHDVPEQGFVFEVGEGCIYFAGDTGAHDSFSAIAERYRPRFALLPVDGGRLRGESVRTLTPGEAVSAAQQLGVEGVCPSHADAVFKDWLAEHLLAEQIVGAVAAFRQQLAERLPQVAFHAPRLGQWVAL